MLFTNRYYIKYNKQYINYTKQGYNNYAFHGGNGNNNNDKYIIPILCGILYMFINKKKN